VRIPGGSRVRMPGGFHRSRRRNRIRIAPANEARMVWRVIGVGAAFVLFAGRRGP